MMNIGIIGIGQIGGTIAQKLAQVGHTVKVANSKGIDSIADFAEKIGAIPADLHSVGVNIDVLILSIPTPAIANLPPSLWANLSPDTVIVDTGNYYPEFRDKPIREIDNGQPESLWVSDVVGRGVVKAFNMLLAHSLTHLGKTKGDPNRLAMWVAGDDESQKQLVMSLVDECGFEPLDAGDLANSWQQQPNSAGYCCDYTADELRQSRANSAQTPNGVHQNRAYAVGELPKLTGGDFSHNKVIKANRILNT
ncbi:reductase [Bibersteinia trehalosi USDA-ARS-USMARC-188]|uniref:Reductase n=2 Tax=Bibersteinia trehalosi TaxID=47735 RepID=A0A4V7ICP2_BIBTR|nr:NAD(P)-binding domain-containing protein [Bibersteinia trehalosi]AGH37329.1 reductase [Bibersteinia trehalosi USDA-ARS-USMARC-192]AHG82823.1 reductase [Bibersteinia trehalosi USDA-ARS-USMARC-188]AHG85197.1 reductase [Bibersteinia trehalosi USDA-ARS-USMARC-189]